MSEFDRSSQNEEQYYIPLLKLPNARDLLNEFGESIQRVVASGSRIDKNTVQKNEKYGFNVEQNYSTNVNLEYVRHKNTQGKVKNPLTQSKIDNINEAIHTSLKETKPNTNQNITYDIPVKRLIIEVDDELLQMKYDTHPDEVFYFDFQLEKTEDLSGNFKSEIEPMFDERNLSSQGFQWRIPVLQQIIPNQGFDVGGDNHDALFSWNPKNTQTVPLQKTTSQKMMGMLPQNIGAHKKVEQVNNEYWGI